MKKTLILSCLMVVMLSGCAVFQKNSTEVAVQPKPEGPNQVFYGFSDLPIPKELAIVSEKSFVYETTGLKAGVLYFSGNVDMQSLENYFKVNMAKNGWKYINSFRYKDIVLNYTKDDKTCNIKMGRGPFVTDVEIWIGPGEKVGGQRPQFNEPTK